MRKFVSLEQVRHAVACLLAVLAACGPSGDAPPPGGSEPTLAPGARNDASPNPRGLGATVRDVPSAADKGDPGPVPASQLVAYDEPRPKSVLELQRQRRVSSMAFTTPTGHSGVASLVNLNPVVSAWVLLRLEWVGGGDPEVYHLQNPFVDVQRIQLDTGAGVGVLLVRDGQTVTCELWRGPHTGPLAAAREAGRPFSPLCEDWLFLRNSTDGRRTSKEWAADFLRDRVWGGEKITTLVRDTIFKNRNRRHARLSGGQEPRQTLPSGAPAPPRLVPGAGQLRIEPTDLGLSVGREADGKLVPGRWYPVRGVPDVALSAVRPDLVAAEIVEKQGTRVHPLEPGEASALVYVAAFDLTRLEPGFALGTEHPRVTWSERALPGIRDERLPGPDGIGTVAPLVRTGMLSPAESVRVVATFTGGFKRSHGAFNAGELATRNSGSHYGFIEQGVVLSKLQPGLSTLGVYRDGRVWLGTWSEAMNAELSQIRYARQNGVPILESDPEKGGTRPGALVKVWGAGNWSGSVDKKLRTLRAGACLQHGPQGAFLLYGFFTSATPSAMARVFEAYGCEDAMLLDMNALEHTYLAVYRDEPGGRVVERLIDEMQVLDKVVDGQTLPRFIGFADNRDFFFLLRRPEPIAGAVVAPGSASGAATGVSSPAVTAATDRTSPLAAADPVSLGVALADSIAAADKETVASRNAALLDRLQSAHGLSEQQMRRVREIFAASSVIGQGNPAVTRHPVTAEDCRARAAEAGETFGDAKAERICGAPWMAPLYDPTSQRPEQAAACIDRFEFPGIPCEYPVVWVRAREAALLCEAIGKRMCDAHEWEGACEGRLEPPDYRFDLAQGSSPSEAVRLMRDAHNRAREATKSWSYGPDYRKGLCAAASEKTSGCAGGQWKDCGSNTYPVGTFTECRSALGVYDLHGNAAEHMNLPLQPSEMASRGSTELGQTEMKGSWFIFDKYYAHPDWCRWRAPYWHGGRVMARDSHHNYHLGFRCCKTIDREAEATDRGGV